jgi:predicted nucleic-acid-binding Zn-ribbon protein
MGAGYVAKCHNCDYRSGALMLSGGMLPKWYVAENRLYACSGCKDFVVITEYMPPESIRKAIQEIQDTGICNWSGITEEMENQEIIACITELIPESEAQQAHGNACPKCKSIRLKPVDIGSHTKCPKCRRQKIEFIMDVLWD